MGSRAPIAMTATAAAFLTAAVVGADPADGARKRSAAQPQNASVELLECSQGRRRHDRWAVFRGEMRQLPGGDRMRMRFQLAERVGRGEWRAVHAPGLGVWRESHRGVPGFAYSQRVVGLERATVYRARVAFRWHHEDGALLASEQHGSRPCRQRGRLPNLVLRGDVRMRPGLLPGTARYGLVVANNGRAAARGVRVLLRVDGEDVEIRSIGAIRRGGRRIVRFRGPACTEAVEAVADPGDAIRESSEEDNAASTVCPASGG